MIHIYDKSTINTIDWPPSDEGRHARSFLLPLIEKGPNAFIDNVQTTLFIWKNRDLILPLTVNNKEYGNSYVCSLYGQYISYGLDELEWLVGDRTRPLLQAGLKLFGSLLKVGCINKTVHVNNWLLSTNLYPSLTDQDVSEIAAELVASFPDHAIVFRSINENETSLIETLKKCGFTMLFSREVFLLDTSDDAPFKERHFKKDVNLLLTSGYDVVHSDELVAEDAERISYLYRSLNIDKYSTQNPMFNKQFIELAIRDRLLSFRGLRKDGSIDAIYGCVTKGSMMVAPFFGYDRSKPEELGLYRQISALAVLEAKERGLTLNQSAGASSFKKRRKARPANEYHAVYTKHLPAWRQAPWRTLQKIGEKFIVPFIKAHNI